MASDFTAVRAALDSVPGIPCEGEAPVFAEPWQAQAFAMALTLQQRGVFSWNEWADEHGAQIKAAIASGDPDDGTTYYRHWLATLERLVAPQGHRLTGDARPLLSRLGSCRRSHAPRPDDRAHAGRLCVNPTPGTGSRHRWRQAGSCPSR